MALDDEDMTTTSGSGAEGPAADSGAGSGTPGAHDGGADGGADSGAVGDVVRRRVGLHHRLCDANGRVVLELPDRAIGLPAFTAAAVRALLGGDPVAVGSLPGMEEADQIVLVRRLLREGVVVPAGRA